MINVTRISTNEELELVAALQQKNLRQNLSDQQAIEQGFLTAEYSMDILQAMHASAPAIVAKDGDRIAGYALVATKQVRAKHLLLQELFDAIDELAYKESLLKSEDYVVVGQLCVDKDYRGQGLVGRLYNHFKECLAEEFSYCVTDVASSNQRSLKAHKSAGFEVISETEYGGIIWQIVLWDWRKK
jgi:ribosomal protein S18 acetylase RimI-like enzyme